MDRIFATLKEHVKALEGRIGRLESDLEAQELDVHGLKLQIKNAKDELDQTRRLIELVPSA